MKVTALCFPLAAFQITCCVQLAVAQARFALNRQKSVLLLYDSRGNTQANVAIDQAIRSVLNSELGVDLNIQSEYFEVSPLRQSDYPLLVSWLRRKYTGMAFDVVVAVGPNALQFVRQNPEDLFGGSQIVYWGRKPGLDNWGTGRSFTGVVAPGRDAHIKAAGQFILTLQPDLKRLIVVYGKSDFDREWESAAHEAFRPLENRISIIYSAGRPLEDLEKHLGALPKKTAVLFLTVNQDGANRRLSPSQVLDTIAQHSAAPVYVMVMSAIDPDIGAVGGVLLNQETMAREAADLVLRLLRGEDIQTMPVRESPLIPTVNWRALTRWNIPADRLPRGTVVMYKDPSAWDRYKWRIIAALSLCTLEGGLIVALLVQRARRRRAERSLAQAHRGQEKLTGLLLRAYDDARRRIARDLHDVSVQDVAAIRADFTRIRARCPELNHGLQEIVGEGIALCDGVIKELRTVSYLLHPPLLDEAGLIPALKWFVRGFIERSGVNVELLVLDDLGRLGTEVETALYRVVQESLTNIHRHSGSRSAVIWITRDEGGVRVRITDEGHGFSWAGSKDQEASHSGVGIMGMRQRLKQLGGDLEIESSSKGTTVKATIAVLGGQDAAYSLS